MTDTDNDIKDFIVNAASSVFARYGFAKTTMNEIAAAAKKSKSALYYYFPSKESVFQAILDNEYNIARNEIKRAVSLEPTEEKKLRVLILTRMRNLMKLANFYPIIADEYTGLYDFIEKARTKYTEEEINSIKEILKNGIDDGSFHIKNIETAAEGIFIIMKGLELSWLRERNPEKNENDLSTLMELIFHGISKH